MKPLQLFVSLVIIISLVVFLSLHKTKIIPKQLLTIIPSLDIPKLYPYPVKNQNYQEPPQITARSAVVIDAKTGVTLYEKDPNLHHPTASTTKLMTALVALEKCSPDQKVTIGSFEKTPTVMGLTTGDVVTVQTLLYGLLMASGNDAASVLAYSCAPSAQSFVNEMNQKAQELEMKNTHFANAEGFDDPAQFTTARDLAKLSRVAVGNPLISKIVATKSTTVTDFFGIKTYYLENINKLLGEVEGVEGIKTGQTALSLEILVTKTTRGGNTILTVILGSQDRFKESKELIEWTYANHQWNNPT